MKTIMVVVSISMLAACATLAPEAENVRITKQAADVAGCEVVGNVQATPPYVMPNEDFTQMRNAALGLKADTVFVTSRIGISRGVAYRCQPARH